MEDHKKSNSEVPAELVEEIQKAPSNRLPLGARIARLRKARGLTLSQLAQVCGFSEATLSRVEHGQSDVSAHHLFQMARYLDVDIADFFHNEAAPLMKGMRSITRSGEADSQTLTRFVSEVLSSDISRKSMHPAINFVTARTLDEAGGLRAHSGEEFIYVLSGKIIIHTDLYTPTMLAAGDAMYFEGSMSHAYLTDSSETAKILVIVSDSGRF